MELEDKRNKRKENKKRKIAAYLAVAELNDVDKIKKKQKIEEVPIEDSDENKNEKNIISKTAELVTKYSSNSCSSVSDKPKLEGEEYEQLKKRLRERKKALSCQPLFRLKPVGQDASLSLSKRIPLFMSDIQHLLLYCMVGDRAPYQPHRNEMSWMTEGTYIDSIFFCRSLIMGVLTPTCSIIKLKLVSLSILKL